MRAIYLVCLIGLFALSACSDEPAPSKNNLQPKEDMSGTPDMPNTSDMDMDTTCQPLAQCPQESCGMVDDGCGGKLDCEPCACVDEVPLVPTCGACDLGVSVCPGNQLSCVAPPAIPGLEGLDAQACAGALLYVDISATEPGLGTKVSPLINVAQALDKARQNPSIKAILIKGIGTQSVDGGLELVNGVSLLGGWDDQWQPRPENKPTLILDGKLPNKDTYGILAREINTRTLLYNLKLFTADSQEPSATNYGLHAKDSQALELLGVEILSGAAGAGTSGFKGVDGADGVDGLSASSPTFGGTTSSGSPGDWGTPNFQTCRDANQFCAGARGGQGRYWKVSTGSISGEQAGRPSEAGGAGGVAGTFGSPDGQLGSAGQYMSASAVLGQGGRSQGFVMDGYWVRDNDGGAGGVGPMGAGGGGGGGAFSSGLDLSPHCGTCQGCQICPAPHGGGGGGGGEGGQGGSGGEGGGSSFAIFAINSKLKMTDVFAKSGFGGPGGDGGEGGKGGLAGKGGQGGRTIVVNGQSRPTVYRGGDGGAGLAGIDGGAGGGGAGGNSIAVYCVDTTLEMDALTRFEHGGSAQGGASNGNKGEDGRSLEMVGCN